MDSSLPVEHCRILDATDVAESLSIPKARERHKWACPTCGSSDGLHIYPGAGRGACCFAGCGEQGYDAISLVQASLGLDFKPAVRWLAQEFGFSEKEGEGTEDYRERIAEKIEQKRRERERLRRQRHREARPIYGHLFDRMGLGPLGREYLEGRGLDPTKAKRVGVRSVESDADWGEVRMAVWPDELQTAGLAGRGDDGVYPVPWRTPFLVFAYGLDDKETIDLLRFRDLSGADGPKYLSPLGMSQTTPYLGWFAYDIDHPTIYICEGELDALSVISWTGGVPAVASPGNGVWSRGWSEPLRWFQEAIVLCDGDEAGLAFSQKVRKMTADALGEDWCDQRLRRQVLPEGTDVNDALCDDSLSDILKAA